MLRIHQNFKDEVCSMSAQRTESLPHFLNLPQPLALEKDSGLTIPGIIRVRQGCSLGMGLASLGTECLQRLVAAPELLLSSVQAWLKDQPNHRVAIIESATADASLIWCCKQTATRNRWVRFITQLVNLRAINAFYQGWAFLRVRIRTPRPLAVVAVRRGGAYYEYLLTEAIPAAISLERWLSDAERQVTGDAFHRRRDVALQLGSQLQRLHRHGFDHRDLKPTNILLSDRAGRPTVWLIDLDGVWRWPLLPSARRVQNLARLWAGVSRCANVSASDALRFLVAYLPADQRANWRVLWRQVARRARAKQSRQDSVNAQQTAAPLTFPQIGEHGP